MQYRQGICAATPSPISSLVLLGSAVRGFIWSVFSSSHRPGSIGSGILIRNWGTNPNVFSMSALAAFAAGAGAARAVPASARTTLARRVILEIVTTVVVFVFIAVSF